MGEQSVSANGARVSGSAYPNGRKKKKKEKALPAARKELPTGVRSVLSVLFQAQVYAQMLKRDVWEFALELPNLCLTGLSINDLRWLTCMGYVKHAEEINSGSGDRRAFRSYSRLTFTPLTCFVLTPAGVQVAHETLESNDLSEEVDALGINVPGLDLSGNLSGTTDDSTRVSFAQRASSADQPYLVLPYWDADRRQLSLGGTVVKHYKLPSPNQEMILTAFEEEDWRPRIDDPLPPVSHLNPKRRLHDTIKSLNRHQKNRIVRFAGDGRGEGILWEPMPSNVMGV